MFFKSSEPPCLEALLGIQAPSLPCHFRAPGFLSGLCRAIPPRSCPSCSTFIMCSLFPPFPISRHVAPFPSSPHPPSSPFLLFLSLHAALSPPLSWPLLFCANNARQCWLCNQCRSSVLIPQKLFRDSPLVYTNPPKALRKPKPVCNRVHTL